MKNFFVTAIAILLAKIHRIHHISYQIQPKTSNRRESLINNKISRHHQNNRSIITTVHFILIVKQKTWNFWPKKFPCLAKNHFMILQKNVWNEMTSLYFLCSSNMFTETTFSNFIHSMNCVQKIITPFLVLKNPITNFEEITKTFQTTLLQNNVSRKRIFSFYAKVNAKKKSAAKPLAFSFFSFLAIPKFALELDFKNHQNEWTENKKSWYAKKKQSIAISVAKSFQHYLLFVLIGAILYQAIYVNIRSGCWHKAWLSTGRGWWWWWSWAWHTTTTQSQMPSPCTHSGAEDTALSHSSSCLPRYVCLCHTGSLVGTCSDWKISESRAEVQNVLKSS